MPKIQHIHALMRAKIHDGKEVWFMCMQPNCRYRERKPFLQGKVAMCNCGETFILTPSSLNKARPTCPNCVQNNALKRRQIKEIEGQMSTNNVINDLFREPMQQNEQEN